VYERFYGRTLPYDERRALIGIPLSKQIRVFGEPAALGVDEAEITEAFIRHYESQRERETILRPVIAVLIEGSMRGIPTALVTSKNDEELRNTLPRLGISEYIGAAITADAVSHPKPDPEGLRLALSRLGVPADRVAQAFYIGDTVHDMRAAAAAGMMGVGVTWGAAGRARLEIERPAHQCDTPHDLRAVLFGTDTKEQ
jgi:pyrophosphatase PpaX